jgi:hypothetical protein
MLSLKSTLLCVLALLAATGALALSACGDEEESAASPLDDALGYLPDDAGFALIASTDLADYEDVQKLVDKFPFGDRFKDGLKQGLEEEGVNFEKDVEPLLGNELVIGVADNASFTQDNSDTPFVMAIQADDEDALRELVERDGEENGSSDGHDLYQGQDDDTFMAIKGDVFVLSNDEETLKQALKQRGEDDRLTEDDVDPAFEGLSEDAPIRGYANLAALLASDPDTKEALKVKWVENLETLGFTADASESEVALEYFARTDSEGLSDEDLPLASGSEAPRVLEREGGSSEVLLSLRDPSQIADFAMATAKVLDPGGYAEFETGKKSIGQRLDIDVDADVLDQLTGDVASAITIDGKFGVRAELEDAAAFEKTLAKIMDGLPEFSDDVRVTKPAKGGGFYGVATEGGESYSIGVADGSLVVANAAELAAEVADRGLVEAEGLEGAFVAVADAEGLANEALARFSGGLEALGGSLFTGPLGDLTSSAEASTDGISGSLKLEIE